MKKLNLKLKNNQKGITLIALVITIIILLILAGVTIATLTGDSGILTQANNAKDKTEESKENELRKLTQAEAATYLEEHEYEDPSGETITIPAQCAVSQVEGENTLEDGLVIIDKNGNSFVWIEVPKTITVYKNSGLEIKNFTNEECTKIYNDLKSYTEEYSSDYSDVYYEGCGITSEDKYNEVRNKMISSIYVNGGFWIGQYEVGAKTWITKNDTNDTRKPIIQKNAYPYNYISCAQAQNIASTMSSSSKTSSLLFGIQWDLVLKYIEEEGLKNQDELKVNSSKWGNYSDSIFLIVKTSKYSIYNQDTSELGIWKEVPYNYIKLNYGTESMILLSTGTVKQNSVLNIYDLAGNVREWTLEKSSNLGPNPCTQRGGNFNTTGSNRPAYNRNPTNINAKTDSVGFRVALY